MCIIIYRTVRFIWSITKMHNMYIKNIKHTDIMLDDGFNDDDILCVCVVSRKYF